MISLRHPGFVAIALVAALISAIQFLPTEAKTSARYQALGRFSNSELAGAGFGTTDISLPFGFYAALGSVAPHSSITINPDSETPIAEFRERVMMFGFPQNVLYRSYDDSPNSIDTEWLVQLEKNNDILATGSSYFGQQISVWSIIAGECAGDSTTGVSFGVLRIPYGDDNHRLIAVEQCLLPAGTFGADAS